MVNERDVIIIGAGPAGLSLAISLADAGFGVTVVEKLPRAVLADPPADGREVTDESRQPLRRAAAAIIRTGVPARGRAERPAGAGARGSVSSASVTSSSTWK